MKKSALAIPRVVAWALARNRSGAVNGLDARLAVVAVVGCAVAAAFALAVTVAVHRGDGRWSRAGSAATTAALAALLGVAVSVAVSPLGRFRGPLSSAPDVPPAVPPVVVGSAPRRPPADAPTVVQPAATAEPPSKEPAPDATDPVGFDASEAEKDSLVACASTCRGLGAASVPTSPVPLEDLAPVLRGLPQGLPSTVAAVERAFPGCRVGLSTSGSEGMDWPTLTVTCEDRLVAECHPSDDRVWSFHLTSGAPLGALGPVIGATLAAALPVFGEGRCFACTPGYEELSASVLCVAASDPRLTLILGSTAVHRDNTVPPADILCGWGVIGLWWRPGGGGSRRRARGGGVELTHGSCRNPADRSSSTQEWKPGTTWCEAVAPGRPAVQCQHRLDVVRIRR